MHTCPLFLFFFFFNDTATTEIYTLSLHDALPIFPALLAGRRPRALRTGPSSARTPPSVRRTATGASTSEPDRKSTRLNSSHANISYAVFCLKKKKNRKRMLTQYAISP